MPATLPRRVKIGSYVFGLEVGGRRWSRHLADNAAAAGGEDEMLAGRTDFLNAHMGIAPGQSLESRRDTVLHETMHAAFYARGGFPDDGDEEAVIRALSPILLQVLRDNPDLLAWLTAP